MRMTCIDQLEGIPTSAVYNTEGETAAPKLYPPYNTPDRTARPGDMEFYQQPEISIYNPELIFIDALLPHCHSNI